MLFVRVTLYVFHFQVLLYSYFSFPVSINLLFYSFSLDISVTISVQYKLFFNVYFIIIHLIKLLFNIICLIILTMNITMLLKEKKQVRSSFYNHGKCEVVEGSCL